MELEGSLPHSQAPATCPYPAPDQHFMLLHPTYWRSLLILSSRQHLGIPSDLLPPGLPIKTLYAPLLPPYVLHAPPISFSLICSAQQYLVSSSDHKAPRYEVFSIYLSPRPSYAQISPSAPYFRHTLSLCFSVTVRDQVSHPYNWM
jgi:hypothetical protein